MIIVLVAIFFVPMLVRYLRAKSWDGGKVALHRRERTSLPLHSIPSLTKFPVLKLFLLPL